MKTALLTGSFDPVTHGHADIFKRAAMAFNHVIIGVGNNASKRYLFSMEERVSFVNHCISLIRLEVLEANPASRIEVVALGDRMTADFAYEQNAVLLKGVRMNSADFDYEQMLKDINHAHQSGLDTFIVPCDPSLHWVSSSGAKEVCKLNGNTESFVSLKVKEALESRINGQFRVGLTGTIGSGKSTIAAALVAASASFNKPVHNIDLDTMAHDVLFSRTEPAYIALRESLQRKFGLDEWTRRSVGQLVFSDQKAREALNAAMETPLKTRLRADLLGKTGIVLINGALLIESNWCSIFNNRVILLDTPQELQVDRLLKRGHTHEQSLRRINAQFSTAAKLEALKSIQIKDGFGVVRVCDTSVPVEQTIAAVSAEIKEWAAEKI